MPSEKRLYEEVVDITEAYLGPAARRFVDRQIQNHLDKEPGQLTKQDLAELIDWTKLALAVLTDDHHIRTKYSDQLDRLNNKNLAF